MAQFSDQTDAYPMAQPSTSTKAGLDNKQKKLLGISAATLLLGGAAWAITKRPETPEGTEPIDTGQTSTTALPADVDVAGKVTDSMSFEQAFEAARNEVGVGGVFGWHGHWYNTFEKEEWSGLSIEQRQEFTEMITQEHLPVKPYHAPTDTSAPPVVTDTAAPEPTIIEGHLNGQRVMGLDFDQDGVIDTLVMEGADGYTYRVVDATGDQGLDTLFRYDSLNGELIEIEKIEEPFVLSNDQFGQGLEESMSKEVVDSVLESDISTDVPAEHEEGLDESTLDTDDNQYAANSHDPDDTYVNNGDVRDMDE